MKKLLTALGMAALLAGCASHNNGMGGTSDESNQDTMKTDSINSTGNGGSLNSNSDTSGSTLDNSNIRPAPNTQVTPQAQ